MHGTQVQSLVKELRSYVVLISQLCPTFAMVLPMAQLWFSISSLYSCYLWCTHNVKHSQTLMTFNSAAYQSRFSFEPSTHIQTDFIDYSLPGSSVHGLLQARILEWFAISFSRGSSQPRDQTHISYVSCIGCMLCGTGEKERKKSMRERGLHGDGTWLQKWEHRAGHKLFRNTMYRSVRRRKCVHQIRN